MNSVILFLALIFVFAAAGVSSAQTPCLTPEEAKKVIESIKSAQTVTENKKLRKELLAMREEREILNAKITENVEKNRNLIPQANQMGERHLLRVCQMLKENGWLTKESLKDDGFAAFRFLITNNKAFAMQGELLPVLVEAAKKGFIGNPLLADLVDNIRIGAGLAQIFGTQATIRNNVIYLYPILNEEKVDEWRKIYDLPPLAVQIREFEVRYLLPLVKMPRPSIAPGLKQKASNKTDDVSILGIFNENESLKIETKLVNLNVRIFTQDLKTPANLQLLKKDFAVFEDGVEQEIAFFSTTETPFDLVLLLDFSGSTLEKRNLIKKAAQRFVEAARPTDRIAVVIFATDITIVSDLTGDKAALIQKIKDIEINGGSPIWDSLRFTYANVIKKESAGRRSAIVFMTDGEDNSTKTNFADAMEIVRQGDTTIFPVYIDNKSSPGGERFRRKAQQSLWLLAEESGGQFYKADDVKDLNGVYEQVINDLGKVYSIGYEPKNEIRDGGWRNLTVKLKNQPNLIARTKRGYYAR